MPRILFIDDDESIREFVSMALIDEGYEVNTAPHGAAALELLPQYLPDLILLDMRMPVMDGWAFLREYRQTSPPHVPIIALTASRNAPDAQVPPDVNSFLAKPFDLNELLDLVAQELQTS
jgi:two-component system, chemotaxis family, chemotaxis protein CheY